MFCEPPIKKCSSPTLNSVPLPELFVELDEQKQESIAGGESILLDLKIQGLILELNAAIFIAGHQFIIHPDTATVPNNED